MWTREKVWAQVKALPHTYIFYTRKEVNYLPKILADNEKILAVTSGFMANRTWLAVCTDKRILFLDRGFFFGVKQIQVNLDRLQAIESDISLFFGSIRIIDAGSAMEISMVLRASIAPFVRTVQEAMDHYKRTMVFDIAKTATNSTATGSRNSASQGSPMVNELERLAHLKQEGHLSEEEYQAAKSKLLQH